MTGFANAYLHCGLIFSREPVSVCAAAVEVRLRLGSGNDFSIPDAVGWSIEFDEFGNVDVRCPKHGRPESVRRVVIAPVCCGGGSQWGHAITCPNCPD